MQAFQLGFISRRAGHFRAITNIQIRVAQLGNAGGDNTAAHAGLPFAAVAVCAAHIHTFLLQTLSGVALSVNIGNVVAGNLHSLLRGVNAQLSNGISASC